MEFKPANREWVKNAAIIFLAVMLVLTFFSNTIMNRTLPEVATAYVTNGTITAKVRGSGKVVATGKNEVKATQTRKISAVLIKTGQEVKPGDVLFVMGEGDSEELTKAEETLRQLRVSYQKQALSLPTIDYSTENHNIQKAESTYQSAYNDWEKANAQLDAVLQSSTGKAAVMRLEDAQARLETLNAEFETERAVYSADVDEKAMILAEKEAILATLEPGSQEYIDYENNEVIPARNDLQAAQDALDAYTTAKYTEITEAQKKVDTYQTEYDKLVGDYVSKAELAQMTMSTADSDLQFAYDSLALSQETDNQSMALANVELQNLAQQIEIQQQKIRELAGEEGNQITASVTGVIESVSCTAGDTVVKDAVMCSIEVPDMGHTLSFSVTNDQAQRLRIGDTATISNFYWGSEVVAELTSIRNDPKNPQTNKLLTFDLTGDVTTGSELTVSVGSKSANYDVIIPNSAIRSDTNGSFVLKIEAKSSPLGNRYVAKRVSVEVLAADDLNSAVTGDLENGDYVVTTSSSPINSGDQVRMKDSTE